MSLSEKKRQQRQIKRELELKQAQLESHQFAKVEEAIELVRKEGIKSLSQFLRLLHVFDEQYFRNLSELLQSADARVKLEATKMLHDHAYKPLYQMAQQSELIRQITSAHRDIVLAALQARTPEDKIKLLQSIPAEPAEGI